MTILNTAIQKSEYNNIWEVIRDILIIIFLSPIALAVVTMALLVGYSFTYFAFAIVHDIIVLW